MGDFVKVLLIGSYPPPLGGVSVFIKRYRRRLEGEGHRVDVLDPARVSNVRLAMRLLAARRYDLISLNYPSLPVMTLLLAVGLASRTEVFEHNWRLLESWGAWARRVYALFLRRARALVLIAPHLADYYRAHGLELPAHTRTSDAFIPPPEDEEAAIVASYPAEVREFLRTRRPLVVANAFKLVFREGVDLYGLDMCVELVASLRSAHPSVGLLFALAEVGDEAYFAQTRERIDALGLAPHVYFLTGQRELWPLLKSADLMLRPTSTDGASVSVAEALHFGCPVVASDAAPRPPGTILFKSRDQQDFRRKCEAALASRRADALQRAGDKDASSR
ncbi:MAG TPA: glycosyltransferase family 4 protein [Pyrinomonadaceae bacterium]|nr:glycosyltransferase family 4 protein [Pyrinomonadaceae bacterium]